MACKTPVNCRDRANHRRWGAIPQHVSEARSRGFDRARGRTTHRVCACFAARRSTRRHPRAARQLRCSNDTPAASFSAHAVRARGLADAARRTAACCTAEAANHRESLAWASARPHAHAKFLVENPSFCFRPTSAGRSASRACRSGLVVKGQVSDRSLQCQTVVAGACEHMPLRVNDSLLKTVTGALGCLRDCSARSTEIKTLQRSPGNCLYLPC